MARSRGGVDKKKQAFRYWKSNLKRRYGVTPEWYYAKLEEQDGRCAICGTVEPGSNRAYFCVDHCHHTGEVRGLLCSNCNIGIGNLQDSRAVLFNALNYLDDYSKQSDAGPADLSVKRREKAMERTNQGS